MHKTKTILLCADDFGLSQGVSDGIVKLIDLGRLSATSCMTNMPNFVQNAQRLSVFRDNIRIGLHFNLTEGPLLSGEHSSNYRLKDLIVRSTFKRLSFNAIWDELRLQHDSFIEHMGFAPDFIDGHQHVHQFPIIREVVLRFYETYYKPSSTFIRSTYPLVKRPCFLKATALAFLGGKRLTAILRAQKIPHNVSFAGVYDFSTDADYRQLFKKWLSSIPHEGLIMCHPGIECMASDPIGNARTNEFKYLSSEGFLDDCKALYVSLRSRR